jgi:NTE family protein
LKIDGVFEGGGIKGIAFVGAACCLEEKGYSWERLAGSSAGAIIASMLAVGYTGAEIKHIMVNLDYEKLASEQKGFNIPLISKGFRLFKENGMYEGTYLDSWLENIFKAKGKTKFRDIYSGGESKLSIIASDITRKEMLILPQDLHKYSINPLDFEIWKAVRMSISIPFYFKPVKIEYKEKFSYIVDGGILSNFPVWIFDVNGVPRWPTFGFNLIDSESKTSQGHEDLMSFMKDLLNTVINRNEDVYVRNRDKVRIISIPVLGVKTTEFDISKEKLNELFNSGYKSTEEFLQAWNFREYVRKYRNG